MKIIIDPASVNKTDSVQIRPNRLYFCEKDNINWARKDVRKDTDGVYHCPRCDEQVTDITDSDQGQQIAAWL
jgi:hypothetical protein